MDARSEDQIAVPSRSIQCPWVAVWTIVGMIADRMPEEDILRAFPDLEGEDIDEALRYAAEAVSERELPLRSAS